MSIDRNKYMSVAELAQLRDYAVLHGSPNEWLLIDLATQTGLRVSELIALTRESFNQNRRALIITRRKKRSPKISLETLPISASLTNHIADYLANHPDFWSGQRGKWCTRGAQQTWHTVCRRAGLSPKISIHAARHTIAVNLLRETHNLRLVQKQLGHSSPVITANMYADVTFEDQQAALDGLFPKMEGRSR